jgi:hypothetical protein
MIKLLSVEVGKVEVSFWFRKPFGKPFSFCLFSVDNAAGVEVVFCNFSFLVDKN